MTKRKQAVNPPLVEVFCEFFFRSAPEREWDAFLLPKFHQKIKARFPERKKLTPIGVPFEIPSGTEPRTAAPIGPPRSRSRFLSEDGKTLVQVGENLLVVNQLPPYYGWEHFEPVVVECFECYARQWKPAGVDRASIHYIDKIDIPRSEFNLEEYFNLFPVLPEFPNKPATNIALSYEVQGAQEGDVVVTTLRQHPSANPEGTAFLIQWDYIATGGLPADARLIQSWLGKAHEFLSELFRGTLTDECRKLFE